MCCCVLQGEEGEAGVPADRPAGGAAEGGGPASTLPGLEGEAGG